MFTLFAFTFFLIGVILFGIGLVGEYVGRIHQQVRARPRYVVQTVLEEYENEPLLARRRCRTAADGERRAVKREP